MFALFWSLVGVAVAACVLRLFVIREERGRIPRRKSALRETDTRVQGIDDADLQRWTDDGGHPAV
jgi:hypothetical protein